LSDLIDRKINSALDAQFSEIGSLFTDKLDLLQEGIADFLHKQQEEALSLKTLKKNSSKTAGIQRTFASIGAMEDVINEELSDEVLIQIAQDVAPNLLVMR
jgi:hypothetical protein